MALPGAAQLFPPPNLTPPSATWHRTTSGTASAVWHHEWHQDLTKSRQHGSRQSLCRSRSGHSISRHGLSGHPSLGADRRPGGSPEPYRGVVTALAAVAITRATACGWDTYTAWLPATSLTSAPARWDMKC
jgi:hypothetical protein